ncbi:Co/Zn/Cd efflux system membrane fusion protein [Christiangramia flava JLT2011]|uniref:Putative Co/Zn/Cd efflux system membrane fusion protein n=1 Tax=Christiangramia flava JLT2011 TaxID=1229726 RepID=A0A1L7I953_9FLAO|nr:putative Co/Zn/Cd efflux system membrane fusion protein [Christiangramia flava JLT2011]OSS39627.1 Co/Zn/Cd efflux system membrane fusion protein [Christiangramia flava JLT2011]
MFEDALSGGAIYKKFCPLAFSNELPIGMPMSKKFNHYFGEKMLKCGLVKKKLINNPKNKNTIK